MSAKNNSLYINNIGGKHCFSNKFLKPTRFFIMTMVHKREQIKTKSLMHNLPRKIKSVVSPQLPSWLNQGNVTFSDLDILSFDN